MERSHEILSQTSPIERRAALVDDLAAESPLMADMLVAIASVPPNLIGSEADTWIQDSVLSTQLERRDEAIKEFSLHDRARLMYDSMAEDAAVIMGLLNRLHGYGDPVTAAEGRAAHEADMQAITDHLDELLAICQDIQTRGLPAIVMSDKLREFISAVMPVNPNLILERGVLDAIKPEVVEPAGGSETVVKDTAKMVISNDQRGLMRPNKSGPKHLRRRDRSFDLGATCSAVKKVYREIIFDRRYYNDDPSPLGRPVEGEVYDYKEHAPLLRKDVA